MSKYYKKAINFVTKNYRSLHQIVTLNLSVPRNRYRDIVTIFVTIFVTICLYLYEMFQKPDFAVRISFEK